MLENLDNRFIFLKFLKFITLGVIGAVSGAKTGEFFDPKVSCPDDILR